MQMAKLVEEEFDIHLQRQNPRQQRRVLNKIWRLFKKIEFRKCVENFKICEKIRLKIL
jgi:hypothetical protein